MQILQQATQSSGKFGRYSSCILEVPAVQEGEATPRAVQQQSLPCRSKPQPPQADHVQLEAEKSRHAKHRYFSMNLGACLRG